MKTIRQILEFIIIKILFLLIKVLPHRVLYILSASIGNILYFIPSIRALITANLHAVFPDKPQQEVNRIGRESLINLILTFSEFAWFSNNPARLQKHFNGPLKINEYAKEKTKNGNGFIYVVPHIGNWELAGLVFSKICEHPFAAVARKLDNPHLNKLLIDKRESEGTKIIPTKGAIRGILNSLSNGYIVATLIDQNTRVRDGGIWTTFFGLHVPVSRAPAMFAMKKNCEIALGGCLRQKGKYTTFTEELPKKIADYKSEEEIINDLMRATERVIRKHPEQYLWLYKRFQHIPETATDAEKEKYPQYAQRVTPRFYDSRIPKEKNLF